MLFLILALLLICVLMFAIVFSCIAGLTYIFCGIFGIAFSWKIAIAVYLCLAIVEIIALNDEE